MHSRQDLADLGLCSSDLLLLQMLACFNGQEKSYFVLDLQAEKKWFGTVYEAWLEIIFIWLKHCIKDQIKDFLSFIFQVSNYRNMHRYVIIQETTSDYNEICETGFMLWAQSWRCDWRSPPWKWSTVQLLSLCREMICESMITGP